MDDLKSLEQNRLLHLNREYYCLLRKAQRKFRYNLTGPELKSCRLVGILKAIRSYQSELGSLSSWLYQQVYFETLSYARSIKDDSLPGMIREDISLERIPVASNQIKLIDARLDSPEQFKLACQYFISGYTLKQISTANTISLFKLRSIIQI